MENFEDILFQCPKSVPEVKSLKRQNRLQEAVLFGSGDRTRTCDPMINSCGASDYKKSRRLIRLESFMQVPRGRPNLFRSAPRVRPE